MTEPLVCPSCASTHSLDERFCPACGMPLVYSGHTGVDEPVTEARVAYFEKEGQELVSINSLDSIRPSFSLSKDLDRALLLSALAESLQTFVSDSDPAEPFYRLARHARPLLG